MLQPQYITIKSKRQARIPNTKMIFSFPGIVMRKVSTGTKCKATDAAAWAAEVRVDEEEGEVACSEGFGGGWRTVPGGSGEDFEADDLEGVFAAGCGIGGGDVGVRKRGGEGEGENERDEEGGELHGCCEVDCRQY